MNIRYRVELNEGERADLTAMLSGGKHAARRLKRAQILLAADAGISDEAIASSISVGGSTVYRRLCGENPPCGLTVRTGGQPFT
jgi:hypothetical protein